MRLNMAGFHASVKPHAGLLQLWAEMLAHEYLVDVSKSRRWLTSAECRDFVVDFLNSQGWKVESYTTPVNEHDQSCISHGFVVDDACETFVQWKLSHL